MKSLISFSLKVFTPRGYERTRIKGGRSSQITKRESPKI